jgi:hypothetical protein
MCGEERQYHAVKQLTFVRDNYIEKAGTRKTPGRRRKNEVKQSQDKK